MALATLHSRAQQGIDAPAVQVEVHLANGLPGMTIVGLPELAVRESKDRVRSAIVNSGFDYPTRRITVNLAPADLPKEGGRFDLPIALGILAASRQLPLNKFNTYEFLGELLLDGSLRPVRGALPAAIACGAAGRGIVLPDENGVEAALANNVCVFAARTLPEVCAHLNDVQLLFRVPATRIDTDVEPEEDLADIRGQHRARRALEIAAAGGHSLLMIGPPGTGKSMLARRLPGILPPLEESEALEVAALGSLNFSPLRDGNWRRPPFRSPHHTASAVALVGGGSNPRPGEISLAHHGVLFLDEFPEFDRRVLEVLREPLESGEVIISRAARQARFPAQFQLVVAMNPCPCGYHGDPSGRCRCTPEQIHRYRARVSGPLLDRIDLHVEVPRLTAAERALMSSSESSRSVRTRVAAARQVQRARQSSANARLTRNRMITCCQPGRTGQMLLERATDRLGLSARAYDRILRIARTIADLSGCSSIGDDHLAEAIHYRQLERRPSI